MRNALVFFTVLISDQITKILVRENIALGETIEVIPNFFNLTLVYNPGAAFGIFANLPDTQRHIALGVVLALALYVVWHFLKNEAKDDPVAQVTLFAILGGAFGNIIDRFFYDAVIDFLDVYIGSYHWPAFNIADSAISVGVCFLLLRMLFFSKKESQKAEKTS